MPESAYDPQLSQWGNLPTEDEVDAEARSKSNFIKRFIPIAKCEIPQILSMCMLVFLTTFTHSVMKPLKNDLVRRNLNPVAIQYIKTIVVLPINIVAVGWVQTIMAKRSSSFALGALALCFSAFFVMYGASMNLLEKIYPFPLYWSSNIFHDDVMKYKGLGWSLSICSFLNTPFPILFYLSAELWGSIMAGFLLWAFANEMLSRRQLLRMSQIIVIAANIGLLTSGFASDMYARFLKVSTFERCRIANSLFLVSLGAVCVSVFLLKIFITNYIFSKPIFVKQAKVEKVKRMKVSFFKAINIVWCSRFLLAISGLIFMFNAIANLIESFQIMSISAYEDQLRNTGNPAAEGYYKGAESKNQIATAILSILLCFLPSVSFINGGWIIIYLMAPGVISALATSTFIVLCATKMSGRPPYEGANVQSGIFGLTGLKYGFIEQIMGRFFLVITRVSKYASLDIAKEALSMRIDPGYRGVFKGVYDGQAGKLGKSGGTLCTFAFNFLTNSTDVRDAAVVCAFIMAMACVLWFYTSKFLARLFNESFRENREIDPCIIE